MSFNGVGKYIGWSNLFDYSSIETIEQSEYLPMPNKTTFVQDDQAGFNIDEYVIRINEANAEMAKYRELLERKEGEQLDPAKAAEYSRQINLNKAKKIRTYADLLTLLNDTEKSSITWTVKTGEPIIEKLNKHEFTKIPYNQMEMALKNFISSHIQNTVQDFTNMIGAYSPIEMEDFRGASELSPKGAQSKRMTLMNPVVKYLMQYQNITGKDVIGIAATGIKGAFTWHYYLNDILLNNINGSTSKLIERARFNFTTSRIKGRADATDRITRALVEGYDGTISIKSLPDINWDAIPPENVQLLLEAGTIEESTLKGKLTVDLTQSQILSAATDNAKELILAKVNAGTKLAKHYLFLVTMGFDLRDIVTFMTSDTISFIDRVSESNIYTKNFVAIKDAIKLLKGGNEGGIDDSLITKLLSKFADKYLTKYVVNQYKDNIMKALSEDGLEGLNNLDFFNTDSEMSKQEKLVCIDFISFLKQIKSMMPVVDENVLADLNDFEKIYEAADEFSDFARLLGINQGIKTVEQDFKNYLEFIKNIIVKRERALGLIDTSNEVNIEKCAELGIDPNLVRTFNIENWLENKDNYKEVIKEYYSKIKAVVPIFDIIDHIPQYEASFKLLDATNVIDNEVSIKNKVQNVIYEAGHNARFWSDSFKINLLNSIQAKFIEQFLYKLDARLPYKKGVRLFNEDFDEITATQNSVLEFNSPFSIASFKNIFETYVIPNLKDGKYVTIENGKVVEKIDGDLRQNQFIQSLIESTDKGDMPLYRADIDMLAFDQTPEGMIKMEAYIKGIQALQGIDVGGMSLSDWFILYNLYTNHNKYGTNRLTTIFDSFIDVKGKSSVIKDYLQYVADLDYFGKAELTDKKQDIITITTKDDESFDIYIKDLFMMSATITSSTFGKGDPMYKVTTDTGYTFYERKGIGYESIDMPYSAKVSSEIIQERYNNIDSYLTTGGIYYQGIKQILEAFENVDENTSDIISRLQFENFLQIIGPYCK